LRIIQHPKAFLRLKRNIQPGLSARTQILHVLEKREGDAITISKKTRLSYAVVLYHLHLLETENILNRRGKKSFVWHLTGVGQQQLKFDKETKINIYREKART
jgi:hypothetical protein